MPKNHSTAEKDWNGTSMSVFEHELASNYQRSASFSEECESDCECYPTHP
jgi:hypothetical protein